MGSQKFSEGLKSSQKFWGLFSEVFRIYTKWLPQRSPNYPNHPFGAAKRPQKGSLLSLASLRQPFCIYSENFWEEASELARTSENFWEPIVPSYCYEGLSQHMVVRHQLKLYIEMYQNVLTCAKQHPRNPKISNIFENK